MASKIRAISIPILALMLALAASASLASAATATYDLNITSGPTGTIVCASAGSNSGWHGGSTVTLTWDGSTLASTNPNGAGKWSVDITIPSSATPGSHTITATDTRGTTATNTFTVTVNPVTMSVSYQTSDGSTPSSTPVFHYQDTTGAAKTYALTRFPSCITDVGAGSPWTVDTTLGSGNARWTTTTTSGNAPTTGSTTRIFTYYHQYQVTFQYSIANSAGTGYNNPVASYMQFGTGGHVQTALQTCGPTDWVDAGSIITYPATLPGSGSSEQWATQTTPITAASGIASPTYYHQAKVTFDASTNVKADSTATIVTVAGSAKTAAALPFTTNWLNIGTSLTYNYQPSVASSSSGANYQWSATVGLDQTSQGATFTVTTPGAIAATYLQQSTNTPTQISLMYSLSSVNSSGSVTISGKLTSASNLETGVANKQVTLSYFNGENWVTIASTTTDGNGIYTYEWTLPTDMSQGSYTVKVVFNGDSQFLACESTSCGVGLYVLPEYSLGGIVAFAMCFAAFSVFWVKKRYQRKNQQ